jgi:hypothetical protein
MVLFVFYFTCPKCYSPSDTCWAYDTHDDGKFLAMLSVGDD